MAGSIVEGTDRGDSAITIVAGGPEPIQGILEERWSDESSREVTGAAQEM